ncbi:MAG: EAL domain-containing protein [Gammaproteobacteria bacterium]
MVIAHPFLQSGLSALALYDKNGQELARAGVFTQQPELAVPLNLPGRVQLMWDGQVLLHAVVDLQQEGRVIGKVMTETPLPATTGAFKEANRLGKTGELVLCAPFGLKFQCFPTVLNPKIFTAPQRSPDGVRLPMAYALEGAAGFTIAKDYRHQEVVAAYAPVGDLGLAMVLKMDSAELYAPVWMQLRYLISLLAGVLVVALLLLRWRLTPLVVRLVRSEAQAHEMSASLGDSERRARALLDNMDEGIITISDSGIIELINPAAERLFGYRSEEVIDKNISMLMPEPYHSEHDGYLARYLRTDQAKIIGSGREVTGRRSDGSVFPMDLRVSEFSLEGRRQFIGSIRDITERKRASEYARSLIEASLDPLVTISAEGKITDVNEGSIKVTGVARQKLIGTDFSNYFTESEKAREGYRQVFANGFVTDYPLTIRHQDGRLTDVLYNASVYKDVSGNVIGVFAAARDITARKRAEAEILRFKNVLDNTLDMIFMFEPESLRFVYVNEGAVLSTGYSREEILGMTPYQIKPLIPEPKFRQLIASLLSGEQSSLRFDTVHRRKDDTDFPVAVFLQLVTQSDGSGLFVAIVHDITERMQTQERLHHLAHHDVLTDMPNRMLFVERLKQALSRAQWRKRVVAVLFLDLDRFKLINDTLGHEAGDRLLQAIAARLLLCVREGDTVARFGGDEFAALLDDIASRNDVAPIADKFLGALTPPFTIDGHEFFITASIGIGFYPNDGADTQTLLKNADSAMYRAKQQGGNTYQFYQADINAHSLQRLDLETSLRRALERQEFVLHYQPQFDLNDGSLVGFEVLIRWQRPGAGLVPPLEFIPLLEETGLIVPVGEWVLRTACAQHHAWRAAGLPPLRVAVNISGRQFNSGDLIKMIRRVMQDVRMDPEFLEFEITESIIMKNAVSAVEVLQAISTMGVRLAIDDFGTGYSSLSYLKRFPIDTLKIDQTFVRDITSDADDAAIVRATITLAHNLGIHVVAEGVETREQLEFLRAQGCDFAQGYFFSRPLPGDEIALLLPQWQQAQSGIEHSESRTPL